MGPRRAVASALAALAVAGCGVPSEPTKQAEEVGSVAAEGAILAHDAAEGDTTATFTRVHARALRQRLAALRPKIVERELAGLERETSAALRRLEDDPLGAGVEQTLDDAASAAEALAR